MIYSITIKVWPCMVFLLVVVYECCCGFGEEGLRHCGNMEITCDQLYIKKCLKDAIVLGTSLSTLCSLMPILYVMCRRVGL